MTPLERKKSMRSSMLCILLIALLFTGTAYVNYRPIAGPTGMLFIDELTAIREVVGLPGYLLLTGFGDAHSLRLDLTDETSALLDNPDAVGKEYTIHAEKHVSAKSNRQGYYIVNSMEATDGSFSYTWEDRAAVQAAALWWELPLAFGAVWCFGGVYLFYRFYHLPKHQYHNSNARKHKTKHCK